ncbi:MAG: NUDIX domain-containing protein, partial [Planctomycetota bacterium]
ARAPHGARRHRRGRRRGRRTRERAVIEVCAAVVVRGSTVLVARRARPAELAGKWEFPGGKLERGETPAACLARELREELAYDVEVVAGEELGSSTRNPEEGAEPDLRLTAYAARPLRASDDPTPVDGTHDLVRWVDAEGLRALDLAPLDVPLVEGALRHLHRQP